MRRDHETTDLASAAAFERNNTPGYDERADRYEPDGYVRSSWPIEELIARFGPIMSCIHPTCRTSLTDDTAVFCPHERPYCQHCTWEEACDECAIQAAVERDVAAGLNKWALLDHTRKAHWWVGSSGTACGRNFRQDIQQAYLDDPRCDDCAAMVRLAEAGVA